MPTKSVKDAWDKQNAKRKLKQEHCTHPGARRQEFQGPQCVTVIYTCPSCKLKEMEFINFNPATAPEGQIGVTQHA